MCVCVREREREREGGGEAKAKARGWRGAVNRQEGRGSEERFPEKPSNGETDKRSGRKQNLGDRMKPRASEVSDKLSLGVGNVREKGEV